MLIRNIDKANKFGARDLGFKIFYVE